MSEVSVVLPTVGRRPAELSRAVTSALGQGVMVRQVLVVLDDPRAHLPRFDDPRVRVLHNGGPVHGPSAARNLGVREATADLVAFLDDDDWWCPGKLAAQLAVYAPGCVVATRCRVLTGTGEVLRPDEPSDGADLAQYLFPPPGLLRSVNHSVSTPSLLAPRRLLVSHPFDESLTNWEDVDWLLRVSALGCRLVWVWEPLTVIDQTRASGASQSQLGRARDGHAWARSRLAATHPAAYRNYVLSYAVPGYAAEGERSHALRLLARTARDGRVTPALMAKALAGLVLPAAAWTWGSRLRQGGP